MQGTSAATIIACTDRIAADRANKTQLFSDYLERSAAEQTEKQYALSIADAKSAVAIYTWDSAAYSRLENAYRAAGDIDEANTVHLDPSCIELEDPNLPQNKTTQEKYEALAIRASCENDVDLWQAAMADENTAIAMLPNSSWAYWYRGLTYGYQHDFGAELADLNKAIALAPTDIRPLTDRIRLYEFEHRYADAVRDETVLLRVLDADGPDNAPEPSDYNMRCWDQAHTPNLKGALSDCQQAIALLKNSYGFDPADHKYELLTTGQAVAEIYDSTGYVYLKLNLPTKAAGYYSTALSAYPKFASSLYGRALAEQALGQTAVAATDFTAAKTIDPKITSDFGS